MAILSFTTFFDINQRKVRIQDTSNYSGQGIPLTNIKGVVKVTSPRGVIYNNTNYTTPDVNPNSSLFSGYITLPHNRDGYILAGTYTIQYSVLNSGDNSVSTHSNTYTYSFIVPQITINQVVDGYNSTFNSIDTTSYGSYASLSRVHTVTPPSGSPLSSVSNSNQTISYTPDIWSGNWISEITSTLVYIELDGLILNAVLTESQTTTAYNNNMNVIRGYIETFKLLYETARATDKNMAYQIQTGLLKINTAYSEYDLALFYNDLATAYLRTVDIINELNDYITITFPEHILPFVNSTGGSTHPPVSIAAPNYGVAVNTSQVLSFTLATTGHGGMMPILSGSTTDYLGGDGTWHSLSSGTYALKLDFTAYDSVRAITSTEITNWNVAFGWGNHASAGYATATNYYTKTNLQTSGQASVHFGNLTNKPTTVSGYGITDAIVGNVPITGGTFPKITYDSKGLVTNGTILLVSDIPDLPYSKIVSGTPTTLAGYGISDAYTKTEVNNKSWAWSSITIGVPSTISGYGITDAYTKTEVNAKTWDFTTSVTGKPITISGYGITDALTTSSAAASVINTGTGTLFLSDQGTYKPITLNGVLTTQVVYVDNTTPSGDSAFIFDKTNKRLSSTQFIGSSYFISNVNTSITKDSSDNMVFTDAISGSKTLAELVSGATNYWDSISGGIYYTNYVGVNNPSSLDEALTVNGNIQATDFSSTYIRYKNSNILIGPNAGDNETGNNKVYIANSNTATPLFYGEIDNQLAAFYADVYIYGAKTLNFGSAVNRIYWTSGNNLTFQDANADSGNAITLSDLRSGTYYSLVSAYTDYNAVKSITNANKSTWNKASNIITSGDGTKYLGDDGTYHTAAGGGVTPTDNFSKWDSGASCYRFYTDKIEAGGVSSGGKFYLGTTDPTNTNRLNYNGTLYASSFYSANGNTYGGYFSGTLTGVTGYSYSGYGSYYTSQTGIAGYFGTVSGASILIAKYGSTTILDVNSTGLNLVTGATYKVNGVDILSGKQDTLVSGTNIKTINGVSILGSGDISPIDGIFDWDGTAYNPYATQTSGKFDTSSTDPSHSTRLNYDGNFYAHEIHGFASTTYGIFGFASSSGKGVSGASVSGAGLSGSSESGRLGEFIHTVNVARSNPYIYIGKETTGSVNDTSDILYINDNPSTSGTISGSVLKATIGSTVRIDMNPRVADGASAVAFNFSTHNSITNGSAKIFQYSNQGANTFYQSSDGGIYIENGGVRAGLTTTHQSTLENNYIRIWATTIKTELNPNIADGASAIAYLFDTVNNLTTTGSKLIAIRNNGTEHLSLSRFGQLETTASITAGVTGVNGSTLAPNGRIYSTQSSIQYIDLYPAITDSSTAIAFKLGTSSALSTTGAKLLSLNNNGTEKFYVDKDGEAYANGVHLGAGGTSNNVLQDFYTDVSTSGTGETDLYSFNIPANTLVNNGDKLEFSTVLDMASSPFTSYIKFYFAGTSRTIINGTSLTGYGKFNVTIMRVSASVCRISYTLTYNIGSIVQDYLELTGKNWTISNIIKVTGQAASNNITARFGYIEYKPAVTISNTGILDSAGFQILDNAGFTILDSTQ